MTHSSHPIEYLKKEAKKLFRRFKDGNAIACDRVQRVLKDSEEVSLMRIQHVVAVEYGYSNWETLIKAPLVDLQSAILEKKEQLLINVNEKSIATFPSDHRLNLRVPPPGETPLVTMLRGPFDLPMEPGSAAFADLMDTMTMEEQRRWLDEDSRRMNNRR
jgi:hypothetical protein